MFSALGLLLAGIVLLGVGGVAGIVGAAAESEDAALYLLGFPWFTIVGVYGLWVLLSSDSERLFEYAVQRRSCMPVRA